MSAGKESLTSQDRVEPTGDLDERAMLAAWLDYHRATLRGRCFGLTDDELRRRAVPPSELSLLGLVRHLADVERHWFSRVLAGVDTPPLFYSDAEPDGEFTGVDDASADEAFAAWAAQCEASRSVLAGLASLDVGSSDHGRALTARWVLTHMVEEYARHNGHADLLREAIDGVTGD